MEALSAHTRELNLGSECEDSLCFGPQASVPLSRSYSDSHSSVSSASSIREPVTPTSGRSSPRVQQHEALYGSPSFYGWTPPESDYNSLYHKDSDIKTEHYAEPIYPEPGYSSPPVTEIRRTSIHGSTIDTVPYPSYQPIEPMTTLLHDTTIHPTNTSCHGLPIPGQQWGPYTYCEPNDHHQLNNPNFLAWRNDPDTYLGPPFEPVQPPCYLEVERSTPNLPTRAQQPPCYLEVEKSTKTPLALRVQPSSRVTKRNRVQSVRIDSRPYAVITKGTFRCLHENCTEKKPFKRQEHLKRHVTSTHTCSVSIPCNFCPKSFNRRDNWRSHMGLHSKPGSHGRTAYFPEAATILSAEAATKKKRSSPAARRKAMAAKAAAAEKRGCL